MFGNIAARIKQEALEEEAQQEQQRLDQPQQDELLQHVAAIPSDLVKQEAEEEEREITKQEEEKLITKAEEAKEEESIPHSPIHLQTDASDTILKKFHAAYDLIDAMRKLTVAPVDTMGCTSTLQEKSTKEHRFQCLISLVLSSQTKDQVTHAAMNRLRQHGCTVSNLLSNETTPEKLLCELIYPVSFYKRKAQYIKDICRVLHNQYDDDIPDTVEGLMKLRGVGPKMAYLAMSGAWMNTVGIGVDTHVHRISNRLPWVHTNTPEETRKQLESFVPRSLWDPVNVMLVGFGQTICKPVGPLCGQCSLRTAKLCAYGIKHYNPKTGKASTPSKIKNESPVSSSAEKRKRRVKKEKEYEEDDESEDEVILKSEDRNDDNEYNYPLSNDIEDLVSSSGRRVTRAVSRSLSKRAKQES